MFQPNPGSLCLFGSQAYAIHIQGMRENLALALDTDVSNVSVKATTEEKLGFTGEGLGISAHAVCLLEKV